MALSSTISRTRDQNKIRKRKSSNTKTMTAVDLFAGAGGLSEGFIRAGFDMIAHVEMDVASCFTLKTRMAYHWLRSQKKLEIYKRYLMREITRAQLYESVPKCVLNSVINSEIGPNTINSVFDQINQLLGNHELDILIGGPPCQAYSLVGRSRDKCRMRSDKRNYLFRYYSEFLKFYSPKYFVFENVIGLLSAKDLDGNLYLHLMKQAFREIGYSVHHKTLLASDYGVPQNRKRVIIIGCKDKQEGFYPELRTQSLSCNISELFSDLPNLKAGEGNITSEYNIGTSNLSHLRKTGIVTKNKDLPLTFHIARPHQARDLEVYKRVVNAWNETKSRINYNDLPESLKTHNNRHSFTDRFKVVAGNQSASHTVVAHISKDGHYYIHPDVNQNRSLTPREAARLQTFPDDYFFESASEKPGRTAPYKQIGNAVPVLLAQRIAETLLENWNGR